jgi:hypothetical protein
MLSNQSVNIHELAAIETTAAFAFNWFKPKLCCASLALDMHMLWFASVIRIKEKSVTALAQNGRHSPLISTVIPSEVEESLVLSTHRIMQALAATNGNLNPPQPKTRHQSPPASR